MALGIRPSGGSYRWLSRWVEPENKDNTVPDYKEFKELKDRVEKLERQLTQQKDNTK